MQDNTQSSLWQGSFKSTDTVEGKLTRLKEENQRLTQENSSLKKSLESEQLHHTNLYKDWKQLQETARSKEKEFDRHKNPSSRTVSKFAFTWLLFITSWLSIFTVYNLVANDNLKNNSTATSLPVAIDTLVQSKDHTSQILNSEVIFTEDAKKKKASGSKEVLNSSANDNIPTPLNNAKNRTDEPDTNVNVTADSKSYKVKSKAYFYNQPDGSTRRNAFITHWDNRYATLKALNDKDGFVYVVFTNYQGQVSKGWLLKSDLSPVEQSENR